MSKQQVAVTGMGIVSAVGQEVESFWESISAGVSGITAVDHLSLAHCKSKLGAPIYDFVDSGLLLEHGYDDRGIRLTLAALEQAVEQARYHNSDIALDRVGVVIGTCAGGLLSGQRWLREQADGNGQFSDPKLLSMYYYNTAAELVSHVLGSGGPVMTISTACASSNNAIGVGWDWISEGKADIVFVGGYDSLVEAVYSGFNSVDALDTCPCRPYSADRAGLSLGEGAGFLVLESMSSAERRGVSIHANVVGYGLAADGYHPTAPHPEGAGAARAIETALQHAGLAPHQIDYINGHGTGTLQNDESETNAIRRIFKDYASQVPISSTKAATGHTLGASGVIEGIATICAIQHGFIPPTVGLSNPDVKLPLDFVGGSGRKADIRYALSHSFAFGGNNAVVAFSHPEESMNRSKKAPQPVVISGIGMVTHAGIGKSSYLDVLQNRKAEQAIAEKHLRISEEVEQLVSQSFDRKDIRRMDRNALFALYSVHDALTDAGIEPAASNDSRIGIMTGHAHSVFEHFAELYSPVLEPGTRVRPSVFPNSVYNGAAGYIAAHYQLLGPTSTVNGGEASAALAISHAYDRLRNGDCDMIVVVGSDIIGDEALDAFRSIGQLAGFTSEAAAAIVLETESHAKQRGARTYASLNGYAIKSDAALPGDNRAAGDAQLRAMIEVLGADQRLPDAIWGASSEEEWQGKASAGRFSDGNISPAYSTIASAFGETYGAAAALNLAGALLNMELKADFDSNEAHRNASRVIVNARNSGGTAVAILLEKS
ncbi:beta-ketoacyl-[acyl-carrier-protein] synthase family protein [Paenibacillus sp. MMS18-CY102]|uniref:beta-ketoacyl-[acyl-carrier-protein] synthase family protein n=1 Tax=Paenibacillus sp. MMS18-CY102 TaxID=2682849 RepID=UPI00136677F9|nr:beta-ketoacyl-[acyl-carrier-protein] synthase family protein [Paenibacillus sp. MMS18-CY102]MWC28014.1 hypothetical protein [Paenibacillus sp. MMS18-CY102]